MPLGYRERPSRIAGAVVWERDIAGDAVAPVLPDGCMDLLWMNGRLTVAGPDTRAYHPTVGPLTRIAGIRFAPGAAPALLGVPADELRDGRPDLAELWTPALSRRAAALFESAPSPVAGLEAIAAWRAAETDPLDPMVPRIVTELRSGTSTIATLAADLEIGPRRLHRLSLAAFGYGPKTLTRILRMQRALALARAGTPLAETAFRTGYSDQSHLSREIRDFAGMPLTELLTH
ncbi:helix-turn-helix domain-containing protein [Nocardia sp. NPDC058058]|uniref:helix-turn-helix domain-containing protein n=1 Tax=Nocardia sp. NPDC058058 TaxID=3346317 RepID=UPI0036DC6014